jgi:hypothetical protein
MFIIRLCFWYVITLVGHWIDIIALTMMYIGIAAVALTVNTNADSISAMVAQRWGRTSYFSILLTVAFAFFLSVTILLNQMLAQVRGLPMPFGTVCYVIHFCLFANACNVHLLSINRW